MPATAPVEPIEAVARGSMRRESPANDGEQVAGAGLAVSVEGDFGTDAAIAAFLLAPSVTPRGRLPCSLVVLATQRD